MARLVAMLVLTVAFAGCSDRAPAPSPDQIAPARPAEPARRTPLELQPPSALADALPDRLGGFARTGAVVPHVELGALPTTRVTAHYRDGERHASLRIVDAARSRDLVAGFAAAQHVGAIDPPGGDELVPTGIGGRPGLVSWAPATSSSEAQVLVSNRFVVALTVTPAEVPEEAVDLLDAMPFGPLEALAR